jgi:hypothetical protein
VELTNRQLVALVNLFRSDVGAADTYMELKREGLRKAWVMDQLESAWIYLFFVLVFAVVFAI